MLRLTVLCLLATCAFTLPSNLLFRRQAERIVGGSRAEEGQFKHQVALELTKSKRHQCGGTIIDKNTILTAAHCVFQLSASDFTVITGSTKLDAGGDKYKVERIIQHPDYNIKTKQNDLAIIKTAEHIRWTPNVQSIPLATSELEAGEEVVLSGWGFTSWPSSTTPNDLMFIKLKAISNTDCALRMIWYNTITENQVCTLTGRGEGACGGDSGGPLISSPSYQPRLAGVVSWGIPCGAGSPDIYASVFSYKDWIYKQMDNLENV